MKEELENGRKEENIVGGREGRVKRKKQEREKEGILQRGKEESYGTEMENENTKKKGKIKGEGCRRALR